MQTAAPHNIIGQAMKLAFHNWGTKDKKYKATFKKLDDSGFAIIHAGLSEIDKQEPGYYDVWWATNHMRFYKTSGNQLRYVHELMYHFLSAYCGGTLAKATDNRKKKNTRPKIVKSGRTDSSDSLQVSQV